MVSTHFKFCGADLTAGHRHTQQGEGVAAGEMSEMITAMQEESAALKAKLAEEQAKNKKLHEEIQDMKNVRNSDSEAVKLKVRCRLQ